MHLYSAKSRNAANALNRQSHCKQKCLQFMSECFDWNVWGSKVSRKTVPCSRSLYGETAVAVIRPGSWNSQSTRVRGSTLAADDRWQRLTIFPSVPCCHLYARTMGWAYIFLCWLTYRFFGADIHFFKLESWCPVTSHLLWILMSTDC